MLSIGQALISASNLLGRTRRSPAAPEPTPQAAPPTIAPPEPFVEPAGDFSRGAPYFEAVAAALKDAGYIEA